MEASAGHWVQLCNYFFLLGGGNVKKKLSLVLLTVLLVSSIVTGVAIAGGWGGSWGVGSLIFNGYFAGLGNNDVNVQLSTTGTVLAQCQNNGGNIAAGRSPVTVNLTETATWTTDENGRADGMVETANADVSNTPPSPSAKADGCPSDNWTVVGYDARTTNYKSAHLVVSEVGNPSHVFFDLRFNCTTSFDSNGFHTGVTCTYVP